MSDLWDGLDIPIIGVSGPPGSGKTLFGLTIRPKRTLVYDFEDSSEVYEGLGMTRVDMPLLLMQRFPKGYYSHQIYDLWRELASNLQPNEYDIIFVDPITDVEAALVRSVARRYKEFGFKSEVAFTSTGGIFWEAVRTEYKQFQTQIAAKCKTFIFSAHLKTVWKGGRATSKKTPKGKSTLYELATLYVILDRSPDEAGNVPILPRASVHPDDGGKSRLVKTTIAENGEVKVVPILPPRFPRCSYQTIRQFIQNPPDFESLDAEYRAYHGTISEEDRLELEAQIAADKRAAAEAAQETAERQEIVNAIKAKAAAQVKPSPESNSETLSAETSNRARRLWKNAEKLDMLPSVRTATAKKLRVDVESVTDYTVLERLSETDFELFESRIQFYLAEQKGDE